MKWWTAHFYNPDTNVWQFVVGGPSKRRVRAAAEKIGHDYGRVYILRRYTVR